MSLKLRPSAKESKRYLLLDGKREDVEKAILDYIGVLGWAQAIPRWVSKIGKNQVLAVNRKEINKIRGALSASDEKIGILKVSGTLKGLKNE
ncbi:MAG: hypothetical protein Q8P57_02495 [Candidatus Pacearchaeota archaeon]|nr:hypothetical protein [Candidatus Pacearchaeota archaeon]